MRRANRGVVFRTGRMARPAAAGGCPRCGRLVKRTKDGALYEHRSGGVPCVGSGTVLREPVPVPRELVERALAEEERRMARAPAEPETAPPNTTSCPGCGRRVKVRKDGKLQSHRTDADDPWSPRCGSGGRPARS